MPSWRDLSKESRDASYGLFAERSLRSFASRAYFAVYAEITHGVTQAGVTMPTGRKNPDHRNLPTVTGVGLHVPPGGYVQDDDWLSIVVAPDTEGMRAYQYVDALGEIEDELRQGGMEKIVIVPAIGD